jgi:hypothetical protein
MGIEAIPFMHELLDPLHKELPVLLVCHAHSYMIMCDLCNQPYSLAAPQTGFI